jgi:hypothetical protein
MKWIYFDTYAIFSATSLTLYFSYLDIKNLLVLILAHSSIIWYMYFNKIDTLCFKLKYSIVIQVIVSSSAVLIWGTLLILSLYGTCAIYNV